MVKKKEKLREKKNNRCTDPNESNALSASTALCCHFCGTTREYHCVVVA